MIRAYRSPLLFLLAAAFAGVHGQPQTAPRTSYTIPLLKLSASFNEQSRRVERVRIASEGSDDYVSITPYNDESIRFTRTGREKSVFPEVGEGAWLISEFEREQLHAVVQSLIPTLEGLEKDLAKERFDRCLYLDAFLPRFLRGFYYLVEAMRNGHEPLPVVARVPESAYDVSLNSPKSDERIVTWRNTPQQVMKLRIVSKEFAFQLEKWLKEEQKQKKPDPTRLFNADTLKAYSLFIRVYFNLTPPPKIAS